MAPTGRATPPKFYDPQFIENTALFTAEEKAELHELSTACSKYELFGSEERQILTAAFAFVDSMCRMEGVELDGNGLAMLLETGKTWHGVKVQDSVLAWNAYQAFRYIKDNAELTVSLETVQQLHGLLNGWLIQNPRELGCMKISANYVPACNYHPLPSGPELSTAMDKVLAVSGQLADPFDRALYLHNNIAYLKYFASGNRRTALCLQLLSLRHDKVMPLLLPARISKELRRSYFAALQAYYLTGDYSLSRRFFLACYRQQAADIQRELLEQHLFAEDLIHSHLVAETSDPATIEILQHIGQPQEPHCRYLPQFFLVEKQSLQQSGLKPASLKLYASGYDFYLRKEVTDSGLKAMLLGYTKQPA